MTTSLAREPWSAGAPPESLPAYVYDLTELDAHMRRVRAALGDVEVYYAVKANPDPGLLRTLAPYVDGFEVASGGELAHVREHFPGTPVALGGPGKTDEELLADVTRLHVESPSEMPPAARRRPSGRRAAAGQSGHSRSRAPRWPWAAARRRSAWILPGSPSAWPSLEGQETVRARGIHAHLASGLDASRMLEVAEAVLTYARGLGLSPRSTSAAGWPSPTPTRTERFDWAPYGRGPGRGCAAPGEVLRIEPGRSLTVYCGRYVTQVIDVKRGARRAVRGGRRRDPPPPHPRHEGPRPAADHRRAPGEPDDHRRPAVHPEGRPGPEGAHSV